VDDIALGSRIAVEAAGFLPRHTALRAVDGAPLSLWPRAGRAGFDETLIRELVYTDAGTCCAPGSGADARAPLLRMRTGSVATVGLPSSLQGTPAAGALDDAIDGVNDAAEGLVTFRLSGTSRGDVRVEIVPTGATPDGRPAGAYFAADRQGMWITGGRLVLSRADFGRLPEVGPGESETLWYLTSLFAHELAHCLGLQHSSVVGLMGPVWSATYAGLPSPENLVPARLTRAERALLHLSYQREAGNVFPDDDPAVASRAREGSPVVCVIPPRPQLDSVRTQ
jgi:hypothetical protein